MKNGYKIDFKNNTITVNYKFAAAMNEYGSAEYKIYRKIMRDFPRLELVIKSGRKQTTPRYNKRFTYENMEKYISTFANSEELQIMFKTVKRKSALLASPYKYVCDWFKAQFPDYEETPTFEKNDIVVSLIPEPKEEDYKRKEEKAA
ncbi:MAG: hypothetical protein J1F01_07890 [Oscillospiraceae bacterium]|nr:hypothetical protein [Oscillospiraceae bacterium]